MNPSEYFYTSDHEWAGLDGTIVTVGITSHAQEALGDIIYVTMPEQGRTLDASESFGEIESVKSVSELYSPCAGEVIEVNEALEGSPELVNSDPYTEGWIIKIRVASTDALSNLMSAEEYQAHVDAEG